MYRLFINDEEAELSKNTKVQLNKLLIDLNDLTARGINFTNSFILPFTSKNDRLCGYPSRLASNNQSFESQPNYLLLDDTTIVSRGEVVIREYDEKKGIKIQLAEGVDFWNRTGAKLLNDLDLHGDDFTFTTANMNALKVKSASVFVTALHSATGGATGTALTNYNATRPCYNFRVILDHIIEEAGYTADYGNIFEKTRLLDLGCLSNAEKFYVTDFKRRFQDSAQFGNISYTGATAIFSKSGNVSQSGATLTNALYKTSYVIKGMVISASPTEILLNVNGDVERIIVPQGRSFINFKTDEVEIGATFVINFPTPITLEDVYIYSAINEADIFAEKNSLSVVDYRVLADYNLPQQTQKQFIKNIMSIFFIDFMIDEANKEIVFRYLPDIIEGNNALDFSSKVNRYYSVTSGETYGQLSIFRYNNDDDINENRGAAYINIDNLNAPETKEIINISDYSASREINVSTNNILLVNIYDTQGNERQSVRDRILVFEETGTFGINAVFTPIAWQRLYSNHFASFIQATKRERVIEMDAFINDLDFRELQRNPVIYIDFLQSVFLVTEISGYDRKNLCKLKLIKFN
jgi:hypothetical protein